MHNPRITPKEWGLIKGALRRVFSRSELRRKTLERNYIEHSDEKRPRVTKWSWCTQCGVVEASYLMQVDHITPVIEIGRTIHDIGIVELVDRIWCAMENLQTICIDCHNQKSKLERALRRKERKK